MFDFLNKVLNWNGWNWPGWEAVSAIALTITIIVIAVQACATKKFTKFSVMPRVRFYLRSRKTAFSRSKNKLNLTLPRSMGLKEKLETLFIVLNNSEFPALLKVKIRFEINGKRGSFIKEFWKKPLPASSKISLYPNVINLERAIKEVGSIKDKKIIAHIKYAYGPEFAPEIKSKTLSQTWIFDLNKYEWRGPAGIEDINIYLPGEEKIKK